MKAVFAVLSLVLSATLFSFTFSEPNTGIQVEIPDTYLFSEDSTYDSSCPYWYTFVDGAGNVLSIEIEEYTQEQTLSRHFHKTITGSDFLIERSVICEALEFKNLSISGIDFTKLMVRLFGLTGTGAESLYICDYLFVHDHFGITIGIIKREVSSESTEIIERDMVKMLESLTFSTCF